MQVRGTNILLEPNEEGICICEKIYFQIYFKTKEFTKNTKKGILLYRRLKNINNYSESVIKMHQRKYFEEEIYLLEKIKNGCQISLPKSSKINTLDPFINDKKILQVGGRLKRSNLNTDYVHSILLSGEGIVKSLIRKWYHGSIEYDTRILVSEGKLSSATINIKHEYKYESYV